MLLPDSDIQYHTLVADPPWSYNDKLMSSNTGFSSGRKNSRGAANHYATMPIKDIIGLRADTFGDHRVAGFHIADRAHLYLWTTNAFMDESYDVCRAWGFEPKTILTWVKPQIGMGFYFRNNTEHVLFGVKGSKPVPRLKVKNQPTAFTARRGKHSQKPDEFYDIVENCSPGPYVELFARRTRPHWTAWGFEAPQ